MRRKKRKASAPRKLGKRHAAAAHQAKRIFEGLPHGSQLGSVYYDVLQKCGVPSKDAKTIAGTWMLDHQLKAAS